MSNTKNSPIVAIDSMILVWGVRGDGTSEQTKRTQWLLRNLENDEAQVMVPSVVLAEYLTLVEPQHHREVIAALNESFFIPPFDVRCATVAAGLFGEGKRQRRMKKAGARSCLRADSLIIATARVYGAEILYSNDRDCRNLADTVPGLTACDLPEAPPSLYEY